MKENERDEHTPPGGRRLPVSEASVCLADLALAFGAIANNLAEASRKFDEVDGIDRTAQLSELERELGELGDCAHEARRVIRKAKDQP